MSLVLDTGTMKYRQNPNQPWRPLVIKAGMNWESMADTYDPDNGTYEVGQYVLEEGMMYRCISEITTPEVWTPAHWTSVNVGDELSSFIIVSDDQPTDETNKIWIAETTTPFGVQVPTMDDHNALWNTLNQLDQNMAYVESGNTATRTYAAGAYISWKGTLYTASAAIPLGDPFAVGTNLVAVVDSLGVSCGGLNSLKSSLLTSHGTLSYNSAYIDICYVYWMRFGNIVTVSGKFATNNTGVPANAVPFTLPYAPIEKGNCLITAYDNYTRVADFSTGNKNVVMITAGIEANRWAYLFATYVTSEQF